MSSFFSWASPEFHQWGMIFLWTHPQWEKSAEEDGHIWPGCETHQQAPMGAFQATIKKSITRSTSRFISITGMSVITLIKSDFKKGAGSWLDIRALEWWHTVHRVGGKSHICAFFVLEQNNLDINGQQIWSANVRPHSLCFMQSVYPEPCREQHWYWGVRQTKLTVIQQQASWIKH